MKPTDKHTQIGDSHATENSSRVVVSRLGERPILESVRTHGGLLLWAEAAGDGFRIAAAEPDDRSDAVNGTGSLSGTHSVAQGWRVTRAEATPANIEALRGLLPNLRPAPLGLTTSAGFGDRLGVATPGHVDAMRACGVADSIAPIFAQQSMRENSRTGRTALQVVDDATLGAFVAGWELPVGADADHLKVEADIDLCLAAGYTFFTIDPGEHVNAKADQLSGSGLGEAFNDGLPWQALETTPADLRRRLGSSSLDLGDRAVSFGPGELERAAVKYGAAVAHVASMARYLAANAQRPTELEISVDETPTPTSLAEHYYLAHELNRLGVSWVSLAPRFVGDFEKGVEYIGDLGELAVDLQGHAAIARALGPYKLSLHSGSDKFTVYPIAAQATQGAVHLKTAGTSYLEALRVVADLEPELLREITQLGVQRFDEDVKSYQISGSPAGMPPLTALPGTAIATLLEQIDARQVLHVTFGSALQAHGEALLRLLRAHPAAYRAALRRHFERHLAPFTATATGGHR